MSNRFIKITASILGVGVLGFILLFLQIYFFKAGSFLTHAYDVSRRLSSPDGTKTVLLVRDYAFDLNFKLFVVDNSYDSAPKTKSYLWVSRDYNPETDQNFHEDLEWSEDSSVIAVIIESEYVFAYDFEMKKEYKDNGGIIQLLESHNKP